MTTMDLYVNYVDATVPIATTLGDYILVDLTNDYLIWTAGSPVVTDLMTHEPTPTELQGAATVIDALLPVTVPYCMLMDYSHNIGGTYYTHIIKGMSENKRYVFGFRFLGSTATEPQLEAWDDITHTTFHTNVLGFNVANNSMVKAVCTTVALPGTNWTGTSLAGSTNIVLLNAGLGALTTSKDLYANIKIILPANYATPSAETFKLSVRFTWA